MKKTICVLTATRAEYGLLRPVIERLMNIPEFQVKIVVTGAHLSEEFGCTYREIENDGFEIDEKIEILLNSDSPSSISKSMGLAMFGFADYFSRTKPDLLIVLGDRYETLAVCCTAMNQRVPIAHLYGGETTEGAIDEAIRHAITKLSYLHFTSTEQYRRRVIQLGEHPDRVFNVGALGVENIGRFQLLNRLELEQTLDFKLDQQFAVITFHPVTLEDSQVEEQFSALLSFCSQHHELKYIFTKANADANGRVINRLIDEYVMSHSNAVAFASLGVVRYLSALKHCQLVIGNSSSGLIEAPSFGLPVINIGDRQKGRIRSIHVIDCEPNEKSIEAAYQIACSEAFKCNAKITANPYGNGNTSEKIVNTITRFLTKNEINLKKQFYDIQ